MNKITALVMLFLSIIIIISIFTNELIFENMSQGRFMIVSAIVNDDSETTSNLEKVDALTKLNISDKKIKDILESGNSNEQKIKKIKEVIQSITL
jgi:peptidoglycan hydrolase CwlO-like protein